MSKKKRILIISCFCVLLLVTGIVNVVLNNSVSSESSKPVSTTTYTSFFAGYRSDRTSTRSQEIQCLDAIIASTTSSAESKTNAETERAELIKLMETELALEGLIKAKGFEDAVISALNNNISVIVKQTNLTSSEVAQIVEIITTQTDYTLDNIKIIEVD